MSGTQSTAARSSRTWLTRNVVAVGLVSLLTDAASEMVLPLLPAFLTTVLGGGAGSLGWIEGVADAVASVLKLVSGQWADRLGRDRPLMLLGYGISTVARPFVAVAMAPWHVLAVRVVDRTGKGLRSSPRDALLSKSVPVSQRGAAFGFHRAMDHAGAVVGPTLAFVALTLWTHDLRKIFLLSAIPGALAVLAIVLGVREADEPVSEPIAVDPTAGPAVSTEVRADRTSNQRLARLLAPLALYSLGSASETFLLLKAGTANAALTSLPLLWMGLHLVKSACSFAGGELSDRWGRGPVISTGWALHVAAFAAMAFAVDRAWICVLFLAYGIPAGLTEGAEKALVSTLVPKRGQGTGFGWYHLTLGFSAMLASVGFGTLWDAFGPRASFLCAAAVSAAGVALFLVVRPDRAIIDSNLVC